jgi:hypothetical protein
MKEKERKFVKKTKSGNIIRIVYENNWDEDGFVMEGIKKRKTFKCKLCSTARVRG